MKNKNYYIAKKKLEFYKKKVLENFSLYLSRKIPEEDLAIMLNGAPGIYLFRRYDADKNVTCVYVGQAKDLLKRCAQHYMEYNHLGLSLKKHKDWAIDVLYVGNDLDYQEKRWIKFYQDEGCKLYNITGGGQKSKEKYINKSSAKRIVFRTKPYNQPLDIYNPSATNIRKGRFVDCSVKFYPFKIAITIGDTCDDLKKIKMPTTIHSYGMTKMLKKEPTIVTLWEKDNKYWFEITPWKKVSQKDKERMLDDQIFKGKNKE